MKKTVTVLVAAATILGGSLLCQAMPDPDVPPPPGFGAPEQLEPFPGRLARILELSEAQKKQIQSIVDEQREKGRAQQKREFELHEQLHQFERAATFNEQAVRGVASALADLETERLVARAKTHYRINAVLSPAQRALAEKLRPERGELPPPPSCGCDRDGKRRRGPADDPQGR